MNINISQLQSALATVKNNLYSEEIVKHIQVQLGDTAVQAQFVDSKVQDADKLASDTVRVIGYFDDAKQQLDKLQDQREPWTSRWQGLRQSYKDVTKKALALDKKGLDYFSDFHDKIASRLDWAETHFEEAKALVSQFLKNPTGPELETDTQNVSQLYTNNRRAVSEYKDNFSSFVDNMRVQNEQALHKLQGDTERLNAEIARYESTANQLLRALREISGIPSWMSWLISEILQGLGIASAEEARRALDQNYAEQQRLRDQRASVKSEADTVSQLGIDLERVKTTLAVLTSDVADIDGRLDAFASEWAQYHHDIVLIESDMQNAADSATKRSLISRLKLMGSSIDALLAAMKSYIETVGNSGLFN